MAPAPPGGPARSLSKGTVYGSLGGSITGALAWLILAAARMHDWVVGLLVVLAGALIFFLSSRAWLSRPERRVPVWRRTFAALCAVTLLVINLRWQLWSPGIGVREFGTALSGSQLAVNAGLVSGYPSSACVCVGTGRPAPIPASGDPASNGARCTCHFLTSSLTAPLMTIPRRAFRKRTAALVAASNRRLRAGRLLERGCRAGLLTEPVGSANYCWMGAVLRSINHRVSLGAYVFQALLVSLRTDCFVPASFHLWISPWLSANPIPQEPL